MNDRPTHPLALALVALGWKQAKLSRESGVVQPTISAVLAGKRGGRFSPESAQRILDALSRTLAAPHCLSKRNVKIVERVTLQRLVFPPSAAK
jgi:transcriptional regulator with XRE-family HTH domain